MFASGRGPDQTKIAPDLVLTNIVGGLGRDVRIHGRSGEGRQIVRQLLQYGYDTAPVTGRQPAI